MTPEQRADSLFRRASDVANYSDLQRASLRARAAAILAESDHDSVEVDAYTGLKSAFSYRSTPVHTAGDMPYLRVGREVVIESAWNHADGLRYRAVRGCIRCEWRAVPQRAARDAKGLL